MIHTSTLPSDILEVCGHLIYSYLDKYSDLLQLASVNSSLYRIVYESDHWSISSLDCCIDQQCYKNYCGRKRVSKHLLYRLLLMTSTHRCSLHLHIQDLSDLLQVLQYNSHLNTLHMRFRFADQPTLLQSYLNANIPPTAPPTLHLPDSTSKIIAKYSKHKTMIPLQHLSIYSTTWKSPNLDFKGVISVLGRQLLSIHFEESSPAHLFEYLTEYCPLLENLTIEGIQSTEDFFRYNNSNLKFLRLQETQIDLSSQYLHFPRLQRLEFIDAVEPVDCVQSIQRLPVQLQELEIQVRVENSEATLFTIGHVLSNLETLILRLRDADLDEGNELFSIGAEAMNALREGCPNLVSLEIVDRLVGGLSLDAFLLIPLFQRLEHICIAYSPIFIEYLPKLLTDSPTLNDIVFFEDAPYFNKPDDNHPSFTQWEVMAAELEAIAERYYLNHRTLFA